MTKPIDSLTTEELRVRVANALGWKVECEMTTIPRPKGMIRPEDFEASRWDLIKPVPDYPNSLDACREFENLLTLRQFLDYQSHLIAASLPCFDICETAKRNLMYSATERCRAFLRTVVK